MSYTVFAVTDKDAIDAIYDDELVSRQSITIRDASALGLEGDERYLLLEGSEEAREKAASLLGDAAETLEGDEAEEVYDEIKAADEAGAEGMGALFG